MVPNRCKKSIGVCNTFEQSGKIVSNRKNVVIDNCKELHIPKDKRDKVEDGNELFNDTTTEIKTMVFTNSNMKSTHTTTDLKESDTSKIKQEMKTKLKLPHKGEVHIIKDDDNQLRLPYNTYNWNEDPREFLIAEKVLEDKQSLNSPHIKITCYNRNINTLLDTGSIYNCIAENIFNKIYAENKSIPLLPCQKKSIFGALKTKSINCNKQALIDIKLEDDVTLQTHVLVIKGLSHELILGMPFITENKMVIDYNENQLICNYPNGTTHKINIVDVFKNNSISFIKHSKDEELLEVTSQVKQHINNLTHLEGKQKQVAIDVKLKHKQVFYRKHRRIGGYNMNSLRPFFN